MQVPGKLPSWIRSLGPIGGLLTILAVPAGGYALYVVDQLREVEEQNLRTLAKAAGTVESLVKNFRSNVESLAGNPSYGCEFQQRQSRLRLVHPRNCEDIGKDSEYATEAVIESSDAGLQFSVAGKNTADTRPMEWAVRLDRVLTDIPFGGGMDVLLIADDSGKVVKQHPDPTAPPGSSNSAIESNDFAGVGLSQRGVRIDDLKKIRPLETETILTDELGHGSTIETVLVAGNGYKMLCQPLVLELPDSNGELNQQNSWVLCGLVEERQALSDALEVAPFLTVTLFGLFFFSLFFWPVIKILTLSNSERLRFADVYLLLLGTWGALMLATILVVTLDTYGEFEDQAAKGLEKLANDVEENLSSELSEIYKQLHFYDLDFDKRLATLLEDRDGDDKPLAPGVMASYNFPVDIGDRTNLLNVDLPNDANTNEHVYPFFSSLYWIEPCSGQQIAKGAIRQKNTPKVNVSQRAYFQKVQENKLWQLPVMADSAVRYHLQTDRSMTTGEFFAALSIPSVITRQPTKGKSGAENEGRRSTLEKYWKAISNPDRYTLLRERYGRCGTSPTAAAVMSGQLISITNPLLAPGVGFAIVDSTGSVIFHSDQRRAKFENLFEEVSDAEHLKSILRAGIGSRLNTKYRAQPHQLFAKPMKQLPWSVVTFLDDEIQRTSFLESLMHSVMLMLNHLLLYFFSTLIYLAIWGRSSPVWMWPYLTGRANDYRWLAWMLLVVLFGAALVVHNVSDTNLLLLGLLVPLVPIVAASVGPILVRQNKDGRLVCSCTTVFASVFTILCLAVAFRQSEPGSLSTANYALVAALLAVWIPGVVIGLVKRGRTLNMAESPVTAGELRDGLSAYIVIAVVMWAIIAVLPAYAYAKLAVNDQIGVLVKHENQNTKRQLTARDDAIGEYYLQVDMKHDYEKERRAFEQKDIYWFSMFWQDDNSRIINREVSDPKPPERILQSSYPWRKIAGHLPVYNATSRDMRYLQQSVVPDDWRWSVEADGLLVFQPTDYPRRTDDLQRSDYKLQSRPTMIFPALAKPTLLMAVLMLIITIYWCRYGARKIFFGEITPDIVAIEPPIQSDKTDNPTDAPKHDFSMFAPRRGLYKKVNLEWVECELKNIGNLDQLKNINKKKLAERFGTRNEVLNYIIELVEPSYEILWQSCSIEEKLVLVQLAQEGVANPKQTQAVRSLIKRGLLFKDPALRIMSRSFALFASSAYNPEKVKEQECDHDGINWASTKKFLFAAIVLLLIFLITTQPAAVETLTKFFTGTAASVVALVTLANKFNGMRGGGGN